MASRARQIAFGPSEPIAPVRKARYRPPMMIPREHGAYAELLFPMLAVLLGARPNAATWLLSLAAIAAFLSNEPLLILSGQRGPRARREQLGRARQALALFGFVALAAGVCGLFLAPWSARYAALLPLLLGATVMWMAARGVERSVVGETTAAAALSSLALPLGLTAGLTASASAAVALTWLVASFVGTSAVRLTVARTRSATERERKRARAKRAALIAVCSGLLLLGILVPFTPRGPLWVMAAVLPVALVALVIAVARPSARSLRSIGWALVLANLGTLAATVTALRLAQDLHAVKSTLPFPMF